MLNVGAFRIHRAAQPADAVVQREALLSPPYELNDKLSARAVELLTGIELCAE
jgi:hypothetical protein